jgi:hypothetical protein
MTRGTGYCDSPGTFCTQNRRLCVCEASVLYNTGRGKSVFLAQTLDERGAFLLWCFCIGASSSIRVMASASVESMTASASDDAWKRMRRCFEGPVLASLFPGSAAAAQGVWFGEGWVKKNTRRCPCPAGPSLSAAWPVLPAPCIHPRNSVRPSLAEHHVPSCGRVLGSSLCTGGRDA